MKTVTDYETGAHVALDHTRRGETNVRVMVGEEHSILTASEARSLASNLVTLATEAERLASYAA